MLEVESGAEEQIDGTASLLDFMNSGIGFSVEL